MSWVSIGTTLISTAGSMYSAKQAGKASKDGGGGGPINVNIPDYKKDPYYLKTQQQLYPAGQEWLKGEVAGFDMPQYQQSPYYAGMQKQLAGVSSDLLSGKVPEWLRETTTPGGGAFEQYMGMVGRDVTRGVQEDIAKRGVTRGGIGTTAIAKTMADVGTKYRWEDLLRTQQNRLGLFGAGIETAGGVRTAGLTEAGQANIFGLESAKMQIGIRETGMELLKAVQSGALTEEELENQYGLNKAQLEFQIQQANAQIAAEESARKGGMWQNILSGGLGLMGSIGGMFGGGQKAGTTISPTTRGSAGMTGGPLQTYSGGGSVLGRSIMA